MDPDRARQLLAAERERLERAIAALGEAECQADTEPGELGSQELFQRELEAGLAADLVDQLAAVGRAEKRLAAGTYGMSIGSGEPIPDERLEALPTAEWTVAEQQARGG